ncbi:MAG: AEC family transporter [Eubacteriales bacterium]|nr:AEC family transporter [Eubacteriales bacterium]
MIAAKLGIQLILMIGIGYFVIKSHIVTEEFEKQLSSLIMKVLLPCLIIKSMMATFSWEDLRRCGQLAVLAVVIWTLTFGLAQLVHRLMGKTASARIMRFCMMYNNFTFVGIPVIEALYGDTGVLYFVVFLVPYRMVYYSSAEPLLSPPGTEHARRSMLEKLKGWFSAPVIAVFVGLTLYLTQIRLPSPISGVISSLSSCASPLGMLLCGMSLSKYPIPRLLRPQYLRFPLVRNFLLPGLILALCLLTGLEQELTQIVTMFAALPAATLLAVFTIQFDSNEETQFEAAAAVLITTVFSTVTVPMWAEILARCYS